MSLETYLLVKVIISGVAVAASIVMYIWAITHI